MYLGEIVRSHREDLGLTQDRLAGQADISKPYLSHIETGKAKNPPTDRVLIALEKALGLDTGRLVRMAHLARTPADIRDEREMLAAEVARLRMVLRDMAGGGRIKRTGKAAVDTLVKPLLAPGRVPAISAGPAVPVMNRATDGYPRNFTDLDYPASVADEYVRCADVDDTQAFAVRVVDDSMEPAYHRGDIVVFSPSTPARGGDDCFARFADDNSTTFKRYYQDGSRAVRLQPLNSKYPAEVCGREKINGLWPAVLRIERVRRP